MIIGDGYKGYHTALNELHIKSLDQRRQRICLKFTKRWRTNDKAKKIFPENEKTRGMETRNTEKYKVNGLNTDKFKNSALIYMQNMTESTNLSSHAVLEPKGEKNNQVLGFGY